jgi:hypothetical protein
VKQQTGQPVIPVESEEGVLVGLRLEGPGGRRTYVLGTTDVSATVRANGWNR